MTKAARCPKCHWGRLTFPIDIEEQRCVGCRAKAWGVSPNVWSPTWPYRTEAELDREGIYDDD